MKSLNDNFENGVNRNEAEAEAESGVDGEVEKQIFHGAKKQDILSDHDGDDVRIVTVLPKEGSVPYRDHGTIGDLLKKKSNVPSHSDIHYKNKTKSMKTLNRSSNRMRHNSASNRKTAQLGGEFSSENWSGSEDTEKKNTFERVLEKICIQPVLTNLQARSQNEEIGEGKHDLVNTLDDGDGARTETDVDG